ncbi:MAG: MFS transporter [Chloroflexi bacterium]|nr:MFS transporter [Chloroflexota bacterium]
MSVAPSPAPETPRGERAGAGGGRGPRLPFGRRAGELRTFESLGDRNFRWFFISTLGQFGGIQTQMLAMGFIVYELTGSPGRLGLVALVNAIPSLAFSLYGGMLADRVPRRLVLQVGQAFQALLAGLVAALLFLGVLRYEHLVAIVFFQGAGMALMMPARQAMIPEIAGEERLMNAISLGAAGMTTMRLIAPAIGGALLVIASSAWLYSAVVVYYLVAIGAIVPIRLASVSTPAATAARDAQGWAGVRDGIRYTMQQPAILQVLAVNLLIVCASMPWMFLLPGWVEDVLGLGGFHLGLLLSVMGVGSLFGSLVIASLPPRRRGLLYLLSAVLLAGGVLAFAVFEAFLVAALLTAVIGVAHAGRMSLSTVLIQTYVAAEYRGRVLSIYMMEFGLVALGVFAVGAIAEVVGLQLAIGGSAAFLLVVALVLFPAFATLRRLQ